MQRFAHALLGAALVAVGAVPAAAQVNVTFDGGTPFAGFTNPAFGAAATTETSVGSVLPVSPNYFAVLRGNDATGSNLLSGYLDAPPGLPTPVSTGSVLTYGFSTLPGTLRLSLNFLGNPFNLGDFSLGTDRNRDVAMVRLLPNGGSAVTLFYAQIQEGGSLLVSGAAFGNGLFASSATGASDFARTYGWMNGSYALGGGDYTLEFTVANQFDKDDDVALGIDNLSVSSVPEPATVSLMLTGLLATGFAVRRRRQA